MMSQMCYLSCGQVSQRIENLNLSPYLAITLRGVTAVALLHLAEFFSAWAFDSVALIRRIALGDDFLEGLWIDVMIGSTNFGLLTISYKDGKLRMNGEQYDQSCSLVTSWENFLIDVDGRTVRTLYRSPKYTAPLSEVLGFSTYIFSGHPGKAPDRYSGYFADSSSSKTRCALRGYRILDKEVLAQLRSPLHRNSALLKVYREVSNES